MISRQDGAINSDDENLLFDWMSFRQIIYDGVNEKRIKLKKNKCDCTKCLNYSEVDNQSNIR